MTREAALLRACDDDDARVEFVMHPRRQVDEAIKFPTRLFFAAAGVMAPSFIVARSVLRVTDKNRDEKLSEAEWNEAVGKHFADWDTNKNAALEESEIATGLGNLMTQGFPRFEPITAPPSSDKPTIKR